MNCVCGGLRPTAILFETDLGPAGRSVSRPWPATPPKTGPKLPVDTPNRPLVKVPAMLGEPENQFSLPRPRSAQYVRRAKSELLSETPECFEKEIGKEIDKRR
jgi:hypothetical protein